MKKIYFLPLLFLVVTACSKKSDPEPDVTMDSPTLVLKYTDTHQFALSKGTTVVTPSTYTWKSSDTLVGKISKDGNFTARKIGKTTITATGDGKTLQSKITISPTSTLAAEPVTDWGATNTQIKAKEKRTLLSETAESIFFQGENAKISASGYVLQNGKLTSSALLLTTTQAVATEAVTFYQERYPDYGTLDSSIVFINDARTFGVLLGIDADLGLYAIYSPYDPNGRLTTASVADRLKRFKIGRKL
ncbi:Ig-like domain-containing protein [Dyadobacter subterraneus]|uniref:Ig-like domain-containing protein n=1 Tax=Dyadobacter subterraneus TaxID=2773304 RepID=A0ABR9W8P3_9BACT|nr:Ig-like domain-containing protein [Dyadobacter subterraneus]MBE9461846.1 Ig-like domain-containing protein [Dyadobacter subterraneus]